MTADTLSAADLRFSAEAHEYHTPEGQRVPSVTEILGAVGVSVDFDGLAGMSSRLSDAIALKRDLGRALHADAHAFDDDDLDWATVDPRVSPYLAAWAIFRENSGVRPTTRERLVWHPVLGFAGTLDGVFLLPNGRRVLIDIKTGDPTDSGCAYQTSAYQAAYALEHPDEPIYERWGVQLVPEAAMPYRITPYTNWQDFAKFQAFLVTYQHQAARRTARRVV